MDNYPPGVTGHEPEIAGPEIEREAIREVGECSRVGDGPHDCPFTGGDVGGVYVGDRVLATFYWDCPECGTENYVADLEVVNL